MSSSLEVPAVVGANPQSSRWLRLLQVGRRRSRDRSFWIIQLMVFMVTATHFAMELPLIGGRFGDSVSHLRHIPPLLYTAPIVYASIRFGREGGMLTGLLSAVLTLPSLVMAHQNSVEWTVELSQITTAVVVGVVLSNRVEYEAAERRRAEEMAASLALVNQQITRAQEAERTRIARELHDETVQTLVLMGHQLDGVASTADLPGEARTALSGIRTTVDETLAGVRQFSRDLRPAILDHLGLVAALEWFTKDLGERSGLPARLEVLGKPRRLAAEIEIALFRIAQESLRNVEKHAGSCEAVVTLTFEDPDVGLTVTDNGAGFDSATASDHFVRNGQLGLAGMLERAQLAGGRLTIESAPGRGTRITATVSE